MITDWTGIAWDKQILAKSDRAASKLDACTYNYVREDKINVLVRRGSYDKPSCKGIIF